MGIFFEDQSSHNYNSTKKLNCEKKSCWKQDVISTIGHGIHVYQ